jgi:hypothetical protein
MDATTMAQYRAKISLARQMYSDGYVKSMEEGLERVGLKEPKPTGQGSSRPILDNTSVDSASLPEDAKDLADQPYDKTAAPWSKRFLVHDGWNADGSPKWSPRYEIGTAPGAGKGGAGGGKEPLSLRAYQAKVEKDPAWAGKPVEEQKAEALRRIAEDLETKASITRTRDQTAAEAAGTRSGPYSDLPVVGLGPDGMPDPDQQAAFIEALRAKKSGPDLIPNIEKIATYQKTSAAFSQRQLGGLNRETVESIVSRYNPTYDVTKFPAVQALRTSWEGDGKVAQVMASARKIVNHLADFAKANAVMDQVSSNRLGGFANPITVTGQRLGVSGGPQAKKAQEALARYKTIQTAISSEFRRFFQASSGGGGLDELLKWEGQFNPYGTAVERQASLQAAAKMMLGQVKPKVEAYQELLKDTPPGSLWLSAQDRARLKTMGVDLEGFPALKPREQAAADLAAREARIKAEASLPIEIRNLRPGQNADYQGNRYFRDKDDNLRVLPIPPPK